MFEFARAVLPVLTIIGLVGFLLTLALGIPAVFWASYLDHKTDRKPPKALRLNGLIFKIGVICFVVLDIGACGSILIGQSPLG